MGMDGITREGSERKGKKKEKKGKLWQERKKIVLVENFSSEKSAEYQEVSKQYMGTSIHSICLADCAMLSAPALSLFILRSLSSYFR